MNHLFFRILRLRQRLWAKPLIYCVFAILAAFTARLADFTSFGGYVPEITTDTIETLLTIISSTMLAVATFAVGSMLSAYHSAGSSATPRAFSLVISDDVSQTALSSFIGAFIFSTVSLIALKSGYYGPVGHFALLIITLAIFAWVILTFVRWVDSIARLGRLGSTIDKAEAAARDALERRRRLPFLGGVVRLRPAEAETPVHADQVGYIQHVDMAELQRIAERLDIRIAIDAVPGTFLAPGRPVVRVEGGAAPLDDADRTAIIDAFLVGADRTFEEDPRFGLIVLSEIAARALSPAVNDPGTAIVIIGRFLRLFTLWTEPVAGENVSEISYDRVAVPPLALAEMFDDAFTSIARDGAGSVEVGIRLQKAFLSLASIDKGEIRDQARRHSGMALDRAARALTLPEDLARVRRYARMLAPENGSTFMAP